MDIKMNKRIPQSIQRTYGSVGDTTETLPAVEVVFDADDAETPPPLQKQVWRSFRTCLCGGKWLLGDACPYCHLSVRM